MDFGFTKWTFTLPISGKKSNKAFRKRSRQVNRTGKFIKTVDVLYANLKKYVLVLTLIISCPS